MLAPFVRVGLSCSGHHLKLNYITFSFLQDDKEQTIGVAEQTGLWSHVMGNAIVK